MDRCRRLHGIIDGDDAVFSLEGCFLDDDFLNSFFSHRGIPAFSSMT